MKQKQKEGEGGDHMAVCTSSSADLGFECWSSPSLAVLLGLESPNVCLHILCTLPMRMRLPVRFQEATSVRNDSNTPDMMRIGTNIQNRKPPPQIRTLHRPMQQHTVSENETVQRAPEETSEQRTGQGGGRAERLRARRRSAYISTTLGLGAACRRLAMNETTAPNMKLRNAAQMEAVLTYASGVCS
jgi:hypothetical protein